MRIIGNCCVDGKEYKLGQAVLEFPGKTDDCQGLVCIFGHLEKIDNYLCLHHHQKKAHYQKDPDSLNFGSSFIKRQYPTTTLPPALSTLTTLQTSPNVGCYYNGKWYMAGEMIEQGRSGHWCYSTQCSYNGQLIHGDNFHCGAETTIPTTIPTTTTPTTTTTAFYITPMYCFFKDPISGQMSVWRGGTTATLSDGTVCRCEYWGRLSCPEKNVGK